MCCAVLMHRLRVAAVVLLAVLLAAQLTLHNHSLIPEGGGAALACSVCAFGADRSALDTPAALAILVLIGLLFVELEAAVASAVPIALTGRAPPRTR